MTRRVDQQAFLESIRDRGGFADLGEADRAARATLRALAAALPAQLAEALADDLPGPAAAAVRSGIGAHPASAAAIVAAVAEGAVLSPARAIEAAQVVCAALLDLAAGDAVAQLAQTLPELFLTRPTPPPPVHGVAPPDHTAPAGRADLPHAAQHSGHPLSEGRPGSSHPLGEARPGSEHPVSEARDGSGHAVSDTGTRSR